MVLRQTFNLLVEGSNPSRPTIAIKDLGGRAVAFFIASVIDSVKRSAWPTIGCASEGIRGSGYVKIRLATSAAITISTYAGTLAVVYGLTRFVGDYCWAPRVGGVLVGLAVFTQGIVFAHGNRMQRMLRRGITLERRMMQLCYFMSIWGTFVWAVGDFITPIWGLEVCSK